MMDPRTELNLKGVHPDLIRLIEATPQTQPFIVIHGLRTLAEEKVYVAEGNSQTLHSRHLPNSKGFGCAVDFACLVNGHVSWDVPGYREVWANIHTTAAGLKVPVEWGGSWKTIRDWGHVQLPWEVYP